MEKNFRLPVDARRGSGVFAETALHKAQQRIVQRQEGVSLLTDRVKSFIQSEDAADMLIASEEGWSEAVPRKFPATWENREKNR